jgi:drug/metabolite transporter (DMT)-like permease
LEIDHAISLASGSSDLVVERARLAHWGVSTTRGRAGNVAAEGTHRGAYGVTEWALMLGSSGIWGASFLLIATSLDHFAPGIVAFIRVSIGALVLTAFAGARKPIARGDWPRVALLAVLWLAFPMTLYAMAQERISSGLAGMLGASIPVFTALLTALLLGHFPAPVHRLGIAIGAMGIVLLGLPALDAGRNSAYGVALILVACVSYALAFNVAVPLVQRYGSMPVFWRSLWLAVPMTTPLAVAGLGRSSFGLGSLFANVTLGAGGTAIAFVLLLTLAGRAGPTRSSMVTYLEAVFAFTLGTIVRHEPVHVLEVMGCAVVLVGAWLATRGGDPRPAELNAGQVPLRS